MIDVSMVHRRTVKAVLTRQSYRLLPLISKAPFIETAFAIVVYLGLEGIALFVLWEDFSGHLTIKGATSYLTRLNVLSIERRWSFSETVILFINELFVSSFDLTELLVPTSVGHGANDYVRISVIAVIVKKSLTNVLESSCIICSLVLPVYHPCFF